MDKLIKRIEKLEGKRDNGTITMEEEIIFLKLVELAENFLSRK